MNDFLNFGNDGIRMYMPYEPEIGRVFSTHFERISENRRTRVEEYQYKNLKIIKQGDRITIFLSLATYLNGNNILALNCSELKTAVEKLSEELGYDFSISRTWRVDYTATMSMDNTPESYYNFFQDQRGYERMQRRNTLYIENESRGINNVIYNKSLESNKRKVPVNVADVIPNLLRPESRIKKLTRNIGIDYPIVSDFFNPKVFEKCLQIWYREMQALIVKEAFFPELTQKKITKNAWHEIVYKHCMRKPEMRTEIEALFTEFDRSGLFNKNCRKKLRDELHGPHSSYENILLNELRKKVERVYWISKAA
jgi:hypothetical protein